MVTLQLKLSKAIVKDLVRPPRKSTKNFEDGFGTNVLDSKEYFLKRKVRQKSENIYAEITRFQKKLGQQINVSNIVKDNKYLRLAFSKPEPWGDNSNMRKYSEWIHGHEQEIG